jgi:hypothetical protein
MPEKVSLTQINNKVRLLGHRLKSFTSKKKPIKRKALSIKEKTIFLAIRDQKLIKLKKNK